MSDEQTRRRIRRAEIKYKVIDEKRQETIPPGERKFTGKGKTKVDVSPTLKSSAEQYGEKDKQKTTATESSCDPLASGARAMIRSTAKKIRMKKPMNEDSQLNEVSRAKLARYKAAATDDLRGMSSLKKETDYPGRPKDALDRKIKSRASFVKMAKRKMQEQADIEEALELLDTPVKMKYVGPEDPVFSHGEHIDVVTKPGFGGAVRALDKKGRPFLVHRKHIEPIKEARIDELSSNLLGRYTDKSQKQQDAIQYDHSRRSAKDIETLYKRRRGSLLAMGKGGVRMGGVDAPKIHSTELEKDKSKIPAVPKKSANNGGDHVMFKADGIEQRGRVHKIEGDIAHVKMWDSDAGEYYTRKIHKSRLQREEVEPIDELSIKTLGDYRRKSISKSLSLLSTRGGNIEHKDELAKRKAGAELAKRKIGLSSNKPRVQSSEGESSARRAAEIHKNAMKNVQPSTQAMKDAESKLTDLAHKSAHLFQRPKLPYAALKANPTHEERQFIADLRLAIESNGIHPVTFADGAKAAISPGYADRIIAKYEAISEESKRNDFVSAISSNLKTLRESIKR